jgi:integrase
MKLSPFVAQILPHFDIRDKTRTNYESAYRRNIAPTLGQMDLGEITKNDLISALAPLTPQSKYQTLMACKSIFKEALERELISASPAATIKAPKITVKPQKFLTWEELKVIDFGKQTKRIHFLALHGLRYGEAAALTAADIYDDIVHITKSKWGETKTKAGVREVPLLSEFEPFPQFQKSIAAALKPYGVTVHSLRKTYAYMLKSSQVHVTTAATLMGHADPMVTLSIYTQVRNDEIGQAGAAMKEFIRKAS